MVSLLLNSHQRSNSKLRCCIRFKSSSILCPIKCCPNSLFSPFFTAFCKTAASFYLAKGPRQEGTHTAVNKSIVILYNLGILFISNSVNEGFFLLKVIHLLFGLLWIHLQIVCLTVTNWCQLAVNWQYIATVSNLLMKLQCDALEATLQRVSAASTAPGHWAMTNLMTATQEVFWLEMKAWNKWSSSRTQVPPSSPT